VSDGAIVVVDSAKHKLVSRAASLVKWSLSYHRAADELLARAEVVTFLAELPDEMALRAALLPDLFGAEA